MQGCDVVLFVLDWRSQADGHASFHCYSYLLTFNLYGRFISTSVCLAGKLSRCGPGDNNVVTYIVDLVAKIAFRARDPWTHLAVANVSNMTW